MKDIEHQIQSEYFKRLEWHCNKYPLLKYIYAVPNGGKRSIGVAVKMKREGVKRGVPDVFIPFVKFDYSGVKGIIYPGMYLETKTVTGKLSKEQKEYKAHLEMQGYAYRVCRSADELIEATADYLNIKL